MLIPVLFLLQEDFAMLIYIVRHGETEWNKQKRTQGSQNVSLTDTGRKQALRLGKYLEGKSIQKIYSSDLDRAFETAKIIGDRINLVPTPSFLLREVCFGEWEGLTLDEIEEKYPGQLDKWNNNIEFKSPNGESISCVARRVQSFIQQLNKDHTKRDEKILIVSHALTCKILILELLDMPIKYINRFRLDNASLSLIEFSPNRSRILFLNNICYV